MFYLVSNAGFPPGEILPLRSFSNIRKFTITKNIAINEGGGGKTCRTTVIVAEFISYEERVPV